MESKHSYRKTRKCLQSCSQTYNVFSNVSRNEVRKKYVVLNIW